ncbi:MAG: hypothetical protein DCF32_15010 [Leptolyngbya sp.]|nr:MAG: hypothetical protein DCF32_15010 [Leptolyngbya sp.]
MTTTAQGTKVDLQVELPEDLHDALQTFLDKNPAWSQSRVFAAATSLFLMQNNSGGQNIKRLYLDTLFDYSI